MQNREGAIFPASRYLRSKQSCTPQLGVLCPLWQTVFSTIQPMQIRQHEIDTDLLILEASDAINDDPAEEMVNGLEADISAGKHRKVIVDCSNLPFLSSFGL